MEPAALIPSPDVLPLPAIWFHVLSLATLVLHLLVMNAMLGGSIIALFSEFTRLHDGGAASVHREISRKLPFAIAFTVNLGVPPLLFLQVLYGHFIYVSSVLMAVYWVSVFVLVMAAYYLAYVYDLKFATLGSWRWFCLWLAVALMLSVGFIFSNNMTLMLRPAAWMDYFANPGGTWLNLSEPSLVPRYLHFVIASLAVGGLALACLGAWWQKRGREGAKAWQTLGLKWFTRATLVQLAGGLWFLFSLPEEVRDLFWGGERWHTMLLGAGVALALLALILAYAGKVWSALWVVTGTVVLMVIQRDLVREAYLQPYFSLESLPVRIQWSPAALFAVSLVIGGALVVMMLKWAADAGKE
jgi:hypothetical protein